MGLFDKKWLSKQPRTRKEIYYILMEDDCLEKIQKDCYLSGLAYDVEERGEEGIWIFFNREDRELAQEIVNRPQKKMESPPKVSLSTQINAAENKSQVLDDGRSKTPMEDNMTVTPSVSAQIEQPESPSDIENRWAGEKAAEELEEIKKDLDTAAEPTGRQRKRRNSIGRTNQIKTRLTDTELVQFHRRLKKSGLAQGEFLRNAALTGQIVIEEHSVADVAMLDELAMIRAELGRQGGLLKMIIKPNEGQRKLAPEEWGELISEIRDMEKIKKRLAEIEVKIRDGNREAQDK